MRRSGSRTSLLFVALVASLGCFPQWAEADFVYTDFSSLAGLQLNGAATQAGTRLRLTSSGGSSVAGSAYRTDLQSVANGFSTEFQFQISQPRGLGFADGFTFIIQNAPEKTAALGSGGGFLGYSGIANSVVVEFDTFDNGPSFGDPGFPHVSVHTNGTGVNTASSATLVGQAVGFPGLVDGQIHTALIQYVPGTFSLSIDNLSSPLLSVPLNLGTTLSLDNGRAYVGFTSGIFSGSANHDILNWSFPASAVPEPSSMLLLGLGSFGLLLYHRRWGRRLRSMSPAGPPAAS